MASVKSTIPRGARDKSFLSVVLLRSRQYWMQINAHISAVPYSHPVTINAIKLPTHLPPPQLQPASTMGPHSFTARRCRVVSANLCQMTQPLVLQQPVIVRLSTATQHEASELGKYEGSRYHVCSVTVLRTQCRHDDKRLAADIKPSDGARRRAARVTEPGRCV